MFCDYFVDQSAYNVHFHDKRISLMDFFLSVWCMRLIQNAQSDRHRQFRCIVLMEFEYTTWNSYEIGQSHRWKKRERERWRVWSEYTHVCDICTLCAPRGFVREFDVIHFTGVCLLTLLHQLELMLFFSLTKGISPETKHTFDQRRKWHMWENARASKKKCPAS